MEKTLIDEGIKNAPNLYRFWTSKIRNKNLKRALESDATKYIKKETNKSKGKRK